MQDQALNKKRKIRKQRARGKVGRGTSSKPRLSVFRSNKYIYAQMIDDFEGVTLVSASSHEVGNDLEKKEQAFEVGKKLAQKAREEGIEKAVFDKGHYEYHGRVKALAEGAREGGLDF
ncbi:MAG: 50S ribosomal protein L18 [Candidatus Magasanikbacteria bacterium]